MPKTEAKRKKRQTHRLSLYVPVWMKQSVIYLASRQGISVSELIKNLLASAIEENKK
jgi:hypothetical protein